MGQHHQTKFSHDYRVHEESEEGLFIGIGVDHYSGDDISDLTGSSEEVRAIAELVGGHFRSSVLIDPDETTILRVLRSHAGHFADRAGATILMWSGHGIPGAGPGTLRLLANDSHNEPGEGLDAVDIVTRAAATGANQILVIVDSCYAGNAVAAVTQVHDYFRLSPPAGEWCWFGLLAACGPEKVRQSQLGPQLGQLLREGPRRDGPNAQDIRRRWSTHQRYIRGDDLWDALIKQWDHSSAETEPKFASTGDARPFIRNPLWAAAAGPLSVAEVLTGTSVRSSFFGRKTAVATVLDCLGTIDQGVYVVTGAQGSGKSALIRKVLSSLDESGSDSRAKAVIVDVSGLDVDSIAANIDRILVARGLLDRISVPRNAFELCGGLQRLRDERAPVPVIALDAFSEATDANLVIDALVTPLSSVAPVLITTRPTPIAVPRQRRASQPPKLAAVAESTDLLPLAVVLAPPDRILDLDTAAQRASGWDAVEEMLDDLSAASPDDDPADAFQAMRRVDDGVTPPPFVLANLLVEELRHASPQHRSTHAAVGGGIDAALDQLVAKAYDDSSRGAAAMLLKALSYGLGAGLPEQEWLLIANAIRPPETRLLDRSDVAATLAPLAQYIVEDSESDEAVYRFAHTLIAQHFSVDTRSATTDASESHLRIASALIDQAKAVDSRSNPHLQRYLWRYVARAGADGLRLLRDIDSLTGILAGAALAVSIEAADAGDFGTALTSAEEAVSLAERLVGAERIQTLAPALAHLATIYQTTGQIGRAVPMGRRAVGTYNELVGQSPSAIADLAAAALNLATMLMDAQDTSASEIATQAVDIERRLMERGGDNRYRLGVALNTLALTFSLAGRTDDAVRASRDAVGVLEEAVDSAATDRVRAALAQALQNLGSHLADRGEFEDAITLTERAMETMSALATSDHTWGPALLETLSDLGIRYIQAGRPERALETSSQAVRGYQEMYSQTPAEVMNYAGALTNYGSILTALGRREAALEPARIAVKIVTAVADRETAKRPALALMLDNYANALNQTGRHTDALTASEQALELYRAAREANPSIDNDVARVLSNHCQRLAVTGRFAEAAAGGAEAIALFEQLAAHDERNAIHAATTRSVVAMYLVATGNTSAGMLLAAQATMQGEQLLGKGLIPLEQLATIYIEATKAAQSYPSVAVRYGDRAVHLLRESGLSRSPEYATAMRNLAALHGMAGQIESGLETIEESVELWEQLLAIDTSHRGGYASALATKARLQLERNRPGDARDTAKTSVDEYRRLPEMSLDDIETCANALVTLAIALEQCGDDYEQLDNQFAQCMQVLNGRSGALLTFQVLGGVTPEHPRIPLWIQRAIRELADADPMLLLHIRRITRKVRENNKTQFDQLWKRTTESEVPMWVFIDEHRIDLAMRWVSTADYSAAEAFLRTHDHLFSDDYNSAISEALLVVDPARAAALSDIRDRLRFTGDSTHSPSSQLPVPDDANQPQTNVYDLAEQFLEAGLPRRVEFLRADGELLRSRTVDQHLRARTDSQRASAAVSLIELSRLPLHVEIASVATDGDRTDTLLSNIAERGDIKVLRQAGVVLMHHATDISEPDVLVPASFHVGVSLLQSELSAQMVELIRGAAEAAPHRVPAWRSLCQRMATKDNEYAHAVRILDEAESGNG